MGMKAKYEVCLKICTSVKMFDSLFHTPTMLHYMPKILRLSRSIDPLRSE